MTDELFLKTYVNCDDGQTYLIDTIRHDGALWLVPKWLATSAPGMQKPARLILMDGLAHRDLGRDFPGVGHHVLELYDPVPRAVLDGDSLSQSNAQLVVVEAPDLWIRR